MANPSKQLADALIGLAAADAIIKRLKRERDALLAACVLSRTALDHLVPEDCWATGPVTGDLVQDLIVCPGCQAIATIDTAIAAVRNPSCD